MNRRYSTSRRKRKLDFLEQILELPDESDSSDVYAEGDTIENAKGEVDNLEAGPSDFEELIASIEDEILNEGIIEVNVDKDGNNNEIYDKDVKFYLDIFGLKQFSSTDASAVRSDTQMSPSTDTDDKVNLENTPECHMEDDFVTDDWDIIEIDVFGTSENKESDCAESSELGEININSDGEEFMEIDTSVDHDRRNDRIDNDSKSNSGKNFDADDGNDKDNNYDHLEVGVIDNDDGDDDIDADIKDSDDDDEDDDDKSDDDSDEDDEYGNRQDECVAKVTCERYRKTKCVYKEENECENITIDAKRIKERSKYRRTDMEERIRKHIEEIERKITVLKHKGERKRKRCTQCKHSSHEPNLQPSLNIEPIQRSKRLAEPIRHAILKRHALRSAWAGFNGSCCGKGCWSKWKWVNIKRVLSDY